MNEIFIGVSLWWLATALVVLIRFTQRGVSVRLIDFPVLIFLAPFLFWAMVFAYFRRKR